MKKIFILLVLISTSCVQKTYKKTVVLTLDVSGIKNIKTVGIRGKEQPLNWDTDYKMEVVKKDSLYKAIISGETAYLFSEIKFTINDEFELKDKDNRKVVFSKNDTTFYKAKFDKL